MGASPWFRELLGFGSSTALDQGVRLASNLVVAALIGPVAWGTWYVLNLVLRYGSMVHLGALNGMNREIPAALGRGDEQSARRIGEVALGVVLASYAVALVAVVGVLAPLGVVEPGRRAWLVAGLLAGQQLYGYAFMYLKARTQFGAASRLQVVGALTFPLATIPGAILAGLEGFLAGQILSFAVLCAVAAWRTPGLYRPRFEPPTSVRLIRIGFPIMLVGITHALFATVDRWVILYALDVEALGQYALAIMALSAVSLLPQVVAQQVYPRMAAAWGREPRWSSLEPLIVRQRWTALAVAAPAVAVVVLLAPWAIATFLPAYERGIPAVLVSMAVPLVVVLGQGYGNAFNVIGLQHWYLVAIVLGSAANLGTSLALVERFGLAGVAAGTVAGFIVFAIAIVAAGERARRRTFASSR